MEEKEYLNILTDVVFKAVFSSTKSEKILEGFLRSVINMPEEDFEKLTIIDPNFRISYEDEKTSILDIKIETKTGKIINIELQVLPYLSMEKRILYYSTKLIGDQLMRGEEYENIKQAINITILDYNLVRTDNKYIHHFMMSDLDESALLADDLIVITLELKKVPPDSDHTEVYEWMKLFKAKGKEEMDMLARETSNTAVKEAVMVIKELSQDEQLRLLAEAREKNVKDEVSRIKSAERQGIQEGRQEGRQEGIQEGRLEAAKEMILAGSDISFVKGALKLSEEDMRKINKEIQEG